MLFDLASPSVLSAVSAPSDLSKSAPLAEHRPRQPHLNLYNDTMSQIFGALKFEDTNKEFDKIIDQALAGDNWIDNPPSASEQYWTGNPNGLTPHKPMPSFVGKAAAQDIGLSE